MQLAKNLYTVCGYAYSSQDNVYAIQAPHGVTLVDTGTDDREYDIVQENLAYWGLGPVTHVILSHAHINHCFNAARFQREGAQIICAQAVADAIATASDRLIDYHRTSFSYHVKSCTRCTADRVIPATGVYDIAGQTFDIRITNGHSKGGLVCFSSIGGRQAMFTGDFIQIAPENTHAVVGWNGDIEYDPQVCLTELQQLSVEEPDMILPGHGQQCLRDAWQMPKNAYVRALRATHRSLNP